MPVVVRTRDYDPALYAALGAGDDTKERARKGAETLYGK
jgi:hypothetical protein